VLGRRFWYNKLDLPRNIEDESFREAVEVISNHVKGGYRMNRITSNKEILRGKPIIKPPEYRLFLS
jgi:hypothetical protein